MLNVHQILCRKLCDICYILAYWIVAARIWFVWTSVWATVTIIMPSHVTFQLWPNNSNEFPCHIVASHTNFWHGQTCRRPFIYLVNLSKWIFKWCTWKSYLRARCHTFPQWVTNSGKFTCRPVCFIVLTANYPAIHANSGSLFKYFSKRSIRKPSAKSLFITFIIFEFRKHLIRIKRRS